MKPSLAGVDRTSPPPAILQATTLDLFGRVVVSSAPMAQGKAKIVHLSKESSPAGIIPACGDKPVTKESGDKWTTNPDHATCPDCLKAAGKKPAKEDKVPAGKD